MPCGRSSRTPSIDEVRSRFERWRQIRQGETAIPEDLWSAAAVARRDGVSPVEPQSSADSPFSAARAVRFWDREYRERTLPPVRQNSDSAAISLISNDLRIAWNWQPTCELQRRFGGRPDREARFSPFCLAGQPAGHGRMWPV
jgi:hypothetical protein